MARTLIVDDGTEVRGVPVRDPSGDRGPEHGTAGAWRATHEVYRGSPDAPRGAAAASRLPDTMREVSVRLEIPA